MRDKIKSEEVPEESRSTSDELQVKVKMDLEEALKTIKTKEAEVEQLKKVVDEKDTEINNTKAEGVTERFRSTSKQLEKVQSLLESSKNRLVILEAQNGELKKEKDAVLVKVKCDLEDALKNVKTKEAEAEQLKKKASLNDAEIMRQKSTVIQLKKIGRNFRERAEAAEKVNDLITEEKQKIEAEYVKRLEEFNLVDESLTKTFYD